ncbi:MAG: SAM-dependent methyltransferase [Myxococcales bacterium]|nr:SAM-dependent methyltransferase [Myxococcales bacterium]
MKANRASVTARFVAVCRGLGALLPRSAQLVEDPFGARLLGGPLASAVDAIAKAPAPLRLAVWAPLLPLLPWALYMQVRTRVIDDALRAFVERGGRQLVILGAGFDARGWRLRDDLRGAAVFEVDHPATHAAKRALFGDDGVVRALAWDFESDGTRALPERLSDIGHDPAQPSFTIWEGVTMYLTPEAFESTLEAVQRYSAPGSSLAFNYVERSLIDQPSVAARLAGAMVRAVGEPFKLGFAVEDLRERLAAKGFRVESDRELSEVAGELLGERMRAVAASGRRLAVVERTATADVPLPRERSGG